MAFTQADLASVEAAITALATGARVAHVQIGQGKLVQYSESKQSDLYALRATIMMELGMVSARVYAGQGGRA
ncbi:MAG: gpW family head-tail joining protein [Acidithiobacillus sp.]|nr:gpW family head-tail joining protein [Acidithiobacillus sp.]